MKKFLILILFLPVIAWAQPVIEVIPGTTKVNGERYPGYKSKIISESKNVEDYLKSHFRSLGKTRERNSYFSLTEATIAEKYHGERFFYAEIIQGSSVQTVWIGADTTDLSLYDWDVMDATLKKWTYDFTVEFYKNEVQEEIDESIKAEQFAEKQHNKLIKESENLANTIQSNEKELIRLQEAIENNKNEHIDLLESIRTNKIEIDSAAVTLDRIRNVVQMLERKKAIIR